MKIGNVELTPVQAVIAALWVGPPMVAAVLDLGPGRWLNRLQDGWLDGHFVELTFVLLALLESLGIWVVVVLVRRLTGKSLAQIFSRRRPAP